MSALSFMTLVRKHVGQELWHVLFGKKCHRMMGLFFCYEKHVCTVTGLYKFPLTMFVSLINSSPTVGQTLTATHCTRCTLLALSASDAPGGGKECSVVLLYRRVL